MSEVVIRPMENGPYIVQGPVRILDAHGHRIPLRPGRTWMELAPRPYLPTFYAR